MFSVSVWFKLNHATAIGQPISIATSPSSDTPNMMLNITSNDGTDMLYNVYLSNDYIEVNIGSPVIKVGEWTNLIVTNEGQFFEEKVYINGFLVATSSSIYGYDRVYLGNAFSTYTDYKMFDELKIFDRVLNQEEVTQLYSESIIPN